MHFMTVKKSGKRSGFVVYSYHKGNEFTAVTKRGMGISKVGMRKGCHLSIEGIRKGYLFSQKWYIKG